jgi:hypothetical protein
MKKEGKKNPFLNHVFFSTSLLTVGTRYRNCFCDYNTVKSTRLGKSYFKYLEMVIGYEVFLNGGIKISKIGK